jgi:hypothetical protein
VTRAHGSRAKYVIDKCRCQPCTVASREDQRARRQYHAGVWKIHYAARSALFVVRNCETGEIAFRGPKPEAVAKRDSLNALIRNPLWATPDLVTEVRNHIAALRSQGVGMSRLGIASGVGKSRVREIAHGIGRKRIKWTTAERILAVTADAAADRAFVPCEETWRLINEMLSAGATKQRIAKHLGYKGQGLQFNGERITKRNADAVRRLHDAFFRGSPRMRAVCRCPWFQLGAA